MALITTVKAAALLSKVPWKQLGKSLLVVIGVGGFGLSVYYNGHKDGAYSIQKKWDAAKLEAANERTDKIIAGKEIENGHQILAQEISKDLIRLEASNARLTDDINREHIERVRRETERSEFYAGLAESATAEQRNLIEHTARLDTALTEGVHLVNELRLTIEQRDRTLGLLGQQLILDRKTVDDFNKTMTEMTDGGN